MSLPPKFLRQVSRRRVLIAISLGAVGIVVSFVVAAGSSAVGGKNGGSNGDAAQVVTGVPASAVAALTAAAIQLATQNGDSSPTSMAAAMTDRQTAVGIVTPGDSVVTDESVYVVVMYGNFVGNDAKVPNNSAIPTGTTLAADFNSNTFQVEDWSISSQPLAAQLSQLGAVTPLTTP
jgi:hypothetical protein